MPLRGFYTDLLHKLYALQADVNTLTLLSICGSFSTKPHVVLRLFFRFPTSAVADMKHTVCAFPIFFMLKSSECPLTPDISHSLSWCRWLADNSIRDFPLGIIESIWPNSQWTQVQCLEGKSWGFFDTFKIFP